MLNKKRNWDVLLIGGASGSGKTSISLLLARLYEIDLVRVDDFQVLLKALTTPESNPSIHFEKTRPNWRNEGVEGSLKLLIEIGQMLIPGLTAVINDHIEENIPMVLEGDFILPELVASFQNPRIKSVFIYEPSKDQILLNYLTREGEHQQFRADGSYSYGHWLVENCTKLGIPVVESRPWDTLVKRTIDILNNPTNRYNGLNEIK